MTNVRFAAIATLTVAAVAGLAQTKWQHQLVANHLGGSVSMMPPTAFVTRDGTPAYTAWAQGRSYTDAWRWGTSLNVSHFGPNSNGIVWSVGAAGQVLYLSQTPDSWHIMVDDHDYYRDVFPASRPYSCGAFGPDAAGLPVWSVTMTNGQPSRLFHGDQEIVTGASVYQAGPYAINQRGDCLWTGMDSNGSSANRDLYRNTANLSSPVLGDGRSLTLSPRPAMNDRGDVLWSGQGTATDGKADLFLNQTNLTRGKYTGSYGAVAIAITNTGHLLWELGQDYASKVSLMLDWQDISTPFAGGRPLDIVGPWWFINENADVAWLGRTSDDMQEHVVLNGVDVSTPALGWIDPVHGSLWPVGIDRFGNVAWSGNGSKTNNQYDVFVNTFDLSHDAIGNTPNVGATALAMGENGQVLWDIAWAAGDHAIYLSTPIPEPSVLLLAVPVVAALARRRNSTG